MIRFIFKNAKNHCVITMDDSRRTIVHSRQTIFSPEHDNEIDPIYQTDLRHIDVFGKICRVFVKYTILDGFKIKINHELFGHRWIDPSDFADIVKSEYRKPRIMNFVNNQFKIQDRVLNDFSMGSMLADNELFQKNIVWKVRYYLELNYGSTLTDQDKLNICRAYNHFAQSISCVIKQSRFGWYLKSDDDPYKGISDKYLFIKEIVGYTPHRGVSPELRTMDDAELVLKRLREI